MAGFGEDFSEKRVAFIGAGVSHRELIPQFAQAGAHVTLCDQKQPEQFDEDYLALLRALPVRLCLGGGYLAGLAGQDVIVRTPGFPYLTPALQQAKKTGVQITSEMELFFRYCPCRIVGITGSDGKTTTSSLIAAMYEAAGRTVHLGGNIGRPLLPVVGGIQKDDIAVVELSSFQLISMRVSPQTAVLTNITPNHLDHHGSMREYIDAKRNILAWQQPQDLAVLSYENEAARALERDVQGRLHFFSRLREVPDGAFLGRDGALYLAGKGAPAMVLHKDQVALRGLHNVENILAAMAAVQAAVPLAALRGVAQTFAGVEHRIEPVRTLNGVQWFNDSIATSPTRTVAGLRAFPRKLIVIAGGYDKNLSYEPMAADVLAHVKLLILTGQTAEKIEAAIRRHPAFEKSGIRICHAAGLEQAVRLAWAQAVAGDIVTLSPASASFDAYPNFEARGRHYKELVNAL